MPAPKRSRIVPRAVFAAAVTLASVPLLDCQDAPARPGRAARLQAAGPPRTPAPRDLGVDAGADLGVDAGPDAGDAGAAARGDSNAARTQRKRRQQYMQRYIILGVAVDVM